jgi:Putative SAM-dependent methyltransferase
MRAEFESVLKVLHRQGAKRFGGEWTVRLQQRRAKLEGAYATLYEQNRDPIAYAPLSAQTAYVFAYAPTRAEYTRQYLLRHRNALGTPLFTREHIQVVSFGGGPASELVGLVRYLEDGAAGEPVTAIEYVVYDKDGDWNTVATAVASAIDTNIEITLRYEEVDAASRTRMANINLSDSDLVIFSYVMSELAKLEVADQIVINFRSVLAQMRLNSKILFIDNLHPIFIRFFQSCKLVNGLNQRNDDGDPIICNFPQMEGTFKELSQLLEWTPRTALNSVSKLIVRTSV